MNKIFLTFLAFAFSSLTAMDFKENDSNHREPEQKLFPKDEQRSNIFSSKDVEATQLKPCCTIKYYRGDFIISPHEDDKENFFKDLNTAFDQKNKSNPGSFFDSPLWKNSFIPAFEENSQKYDCQRSFTLDNKYDCQRSFTLDNLNVENLFNKSKNRNNEKITFRQIQPLPIRSNDPLISLGFFTIEYIKNDRLGYRMFNLQSRDSNKKMNEKYLNLFELMVSQKLGAQFGLEEIFKKTSLEGKWYDYDIFIYNDENHLARIDFWNHTTGKYYWLMQEPKQYEREKGEEKID